MPTKYVINGSVGGVVPGGAGGAMAPPDAEQLTLA